MKIHTILSQFVVLVSLCGAFPAAHAEENPILPPPFDTPSIRRESTVIGWPAGKMPIAPAGFTVSLFAELAAPRALLVLPNGDVLVSQAKKKPTDAGESSPNQITLFKMNGSNLVSSEVFLKDLYLPFGMAVWKNDFFVAGPNYIKKFTMENGKIKGAGKIIASLPFPKPQRHWTRHLLMGHDGKKLYVSTGSPSDHGEDGDPLDPRSSAILEMNLDGTGIKIIAGGLRNPVSMAWEPVTKKLWTVVNERDELGDQVPPDYITSVTRGGFYGWPYAYWGKNEDPRVTKKRPDLVKRSLKPDYSVGAHTASLGIAFTAGTKLPSPWDSGALVSQHGSWNSATLVGYKVLYVPFFQGKTAGDQVDFLTGFVADATAGTVYGRPVMTAVLADGTLLVTDDGSGKIWKVSPNQ